MPVAGATPSISPVKRLTASSALQQLFEQVDAEALLVLAVVDDLGRIVDRGEMTGLSNAGSSSRLVLFLRHHGIDAGSSSSSEVVEDERVRCRALRAARSSASGSSAPNR